MRVSPLLAILLLALPAVLADDPAPAPEPRVAIDADEPGPRPAGDHQRLTVEVHRQIGEHPVRGPGRVNLTLQAPAEANCGPRAQTVHLDPLTGRGTGQIDCRPLAPGEHSLGLEARSTASRPGRASLELPVEPDRLEGELEAGTPENYTVPLNLTLEPVHLDQAPVDVSLQALLVEAPLGVRPQPFTVRADGSTVTRELTALQGSGTYEITAFVEGELTRDWNATTHVQVPGPASGDTLAIDATIEANATVELADDPINDDGKHKDPGDEITTRFKAQGTDHVNVTVYRTQGGEPVELARSILETDDDGRAEHVFTHEPLPAGPLWVQGQAGDSQSRRNVSLQDRSPSADLAGPLNSSLDAGWQGDLTLRDPNFGSTALDPGPLQGLPDVDWTVYKGARWGSAEAEGFQVEIGPDSGASNGTAHTSTIPWPEGHGQATVGPGWARVPVHVQPPADAELRDYRLSVYQNASQDLLATAPFVLYQVSLEAHGDPIAGRPWPIEVHTANLDEQTTLEVQLSRDGQPIANASMEADGVWRPRLPSSLPNGTQLRVEAHANHTDSPPEGPPDALLERSMTERTPEVEVHPVLDGVPTTTPVTLHPAHAHEVEIAYTAYDANTGLLDVTSVELTGPEGTPGWDLQRPGEGRVTLEVPADVDPGRYELQLHLDDPEATVAEIGLEAGTIARLTVEGPDQLQLTAGETTQVTVNVTNRGNVPVQAVRAVLDTGLDVTAAAWDGADWKPAGDRLDLPLAPGERSQVPVRLTAGSQAGEGRLELTLAGVLP